MDTVYVNTHGNPMPEQHGDWIDLATAEYVDMEVGEFQLISLGVSMRLPDDCYAMLVPRSSTFKKYGIIQANSIGIVDNEYSGDEDIWMFAAYATRDVHIPKGTRICQFKVFSNEPHVKIAQVKSTGSVNRGGFGSTGD